MLNKQKNHINIKGVFNDIGGVFNLFKLKEKKKTIRREKQL